MALSITLTGDDALAYMASLFQKTNATLANTASIASADLPETGAPVDTNKPYAEIYPDKTVLKFPNVPAAPTPAPSTVGAAQPPTAPEDTTDTWTDPASAFGQSVPTPPLAAPIAAPPTVPLVVNGSLTGYIPPAPGPAEYLPPGTATIINPPALPVTVSVVPAPPPIVPIPPKVDSTGMPWDARIHSGNGALTEAGIWRKKRGVTDQTIKEVEFELRQLMLLPPAEPSAAPVLPTTTVPSQAVVTAPSVPVPPPPPPVPAPPVQTDPTVPFVPVVPPPPPPSGAIPMPPAPPVENSAVSPSPATTATAASPSSPPATFPEFMRRVTSARIPNERVTEVLRKHGIAAVPLLASRLDYLPVIAADLGI